MSRFPRNNAPQVPSVGLNGGLDVPGLEILPPVSRGATLASELSNSLQSLGGTAAAVAHHQARRKAEEKQIAREHEQVIRGEATLAYQSEFPKLQQQIKQRQLMLPDGMNPGVFAEQLIDLQTESNDEVYRDQYRKGLKPLLVREFTDQQAEIQQDAIDSGKLAIVASAAESGTVESINEGVNALMRLDPLITREKALGSIAIGVGKMAAESGDTVKLEAAKKAMNGMFPVEAAALDAAYMTTKRELREETRRNFNDSMAGSFIKIRDGKGTFADARDNARAWRGRADDDIIDSALREVDTREYEANGRSRERITEEQKRAAESGNDDIVRSWIRGAKATGGVGTLNRALAEGIVKMRPEDKRGQAEILEQNTNYEMNRIAKELGSHGEDAVLQEQVTFLANNGITYKPWSDQMNAGGFINSLDIEQARSGKFDIPSNAKEGYELYLKMGMVNPRLRDAHVTNSTSRIAYDLTEKIEKIDGDRGRAMATAFKAMTRRDNPVNAATKGMIVEKSNSLLSSGYLWWGREARNKGEVRNNVADLAEVYTAVGWGPEEAVDAAVKKLERDYKIVNGWAVNIGNKMVPDNFEEITDSIIADYAKRNKVDAGNLTMIPGELPNTWMMYDRETFSYVDNFDTEGTFSNADLILWWDGREREKNEKIKADVKAKQSKAKTREMVASDFAESVMTGETKPENLNAFGRWLNSKGMMK